MATDLNTTGPLVNNTTGEVHAFDPATAQATGAMSPTMKTYYDTELLENARPRLVFTQLGKSQFLPANHGDTVQWRKWNTFDKALTPLTEGVIPTGQRLGQSAIHVSVQQYGDYAAISDRLDLHAVDNVILGAAEEMGAACGETADTLVRNELCTGTSVMYCDTLDDDGNVVSTPVSRYELTAANNRLTPDMVNKAYTFLKKQKAPTFEGGKYVAVIHPSVTYDLRSSRDWLEVHKYAATREIFTGEIGELHGVRFIENVFAPVLGVAGASADGDDEYVNKSRSRTYTTYFFGKDSFGIIDPEGGALEMVVHEKGEIGGPLNQFSTIGYKFETNGATILYPERLLRVMSCSSFSASDETN